MAVFAAKVQTVEEQAEVRDSLKAVWCKGGKDACNSGTDNREIPRRWYSAKAARSRAKEVRAEETDSWTAEWCNCGKGSNSGGTGRG